MSKVNKNLIDADKLYVVTKQFAGKKYYTRKYRYGFKCDATNSDFCYRFDTKEEAQNICDQLNVDRKKIKHKVEKASRYFCSRLDYNYSKNWYSSGGELNVKNTLVSIDKVQDGLKGAKNKALENVKNFIQDQEQILLELGRKEKSILKKYEQDLKDIEIRKTRDLQKRLEDIKETKLAIREAKELDYDKIASIVETEQDKKFRVLFGGVE